MKSAIVQRAARMRSNSLQTVPPPQHSGDYNDECAQIAASILYRSPLPSKAGLPIFILNAAAFPDSFEVDYDSLLPYVLARLPYEDDLIAGAEYEVVFFAGGQPESVTGDKKNGPGIGWYIQVYQVLSRALRKRLQKIWIVHERSWVRVLTEVFGTIVSPKFKKKVVHVNSLSSLALYLPIEDLLIPPAVYLNDRRIAPDIYVPYATGRQAFGADEPLPRNNIGERRLPRVLREATSFLLKESNLRTEGLFRIPPHSVMLGILKESYDRGQRFIVWKEGRNLAVVAEPGLPQEILDDVHESDAYGIHLAAGLIKTWYRELRQPIFPERCYETLRQSYGSPDSEINVQNLTSLLSPHSKESILPMISRLILTTHLLPMLSIVSSYEASNKMTPDNLAVCFAPTLICGSDQLQDAKMTSVIRRLISQAATLWNEGLASACDTNNEVFLASLEPPRNYAEYADPSPEVYRGNSFTGLEDGMNRIRMDDHDEGDVPPALPPRTSSLVRKEVPAQPRSTSPMPKRKPAPSVNLPPRYSSIVTAPQPSLSPPKYQRDIDGAEETETKPESISRSVSPSGLSTNSFKAPSLPKRTSSTTSTPSEPPSPMLAPSLAEIQSAQLRSVSGDSTKSADDNLFVKPTWAASSRNPSISSNSSYRKPTPPLILPKGSEISNRIDSGNATNTNAHLPKPRTPSPGLLQRLQSWEKEANESGAGNQRAGPGERKQSVDDLRRIYEERAGAVAGIEGLVRSKSNASSRSGRGD